MHAGDAKDEAYWVGLRLTSFSQLNLHSARYYDK